MDEWLEYSLRLLRHWVNKWESGLIDPSLIVSISIGLVLSYDRSELPDWVIILAEGNPEHMADVIAVAREDMKEENNAMLNDLSEI